MKKLLLLLFCMGLFSVTSIAQSSNSERIKEIQAELDKAVETGDFEKAAKLKKEREIRIEIETAVEAGDFDKAAELKAKLKEVEAGEEKQSPAGPPANQPKEVKPKEEKKPAVPPKEKTEDEVNRVTKSGLYMELFFGYGNFDNETQYSPFHYTSSGIGAGIRLGNKFYFGNKKSTIRAGLDVNWLSYNMLTDLDALLFQFSIINPGLTVAKAFNKKIGLEANFLFGPTVLYYSGIFGDETYGVGMRYSPQVKFRAGVFSVGAEYCYGRALTADMTAGTFGVLIGFKF